MLRPGSSPVKGNADRVPLAWTDMGEVSGRVTGFDADGGAVVVSDGHSVTTTDGAGRFTLPAEGPFVFVRRPTGWTADPWFVAASTAEPEFVLHRQDQPVPFRFTHITDLHISVPPPDAPSHGAAGPLRLTSPDTLSAFLAAQDADFVVATGDLTNRGTSEEFAALVDVVGRAPVIVHLLPGNHDHMNGLSSFVTTSMGSVENAADTRGYEEHVGPRWYSFDHGGVHFVALDWHSWVLGLDAEVQMAWLEADLAHVDTDVPWILLFHDQPEQTLMDRLPRPPVATFSGHWHTDRTMGWNGTRHVNTPTPFFAGLDSSPPTYRMARWSGTALTIETVAGGAARVSRPALCANTGCVVVGSDAGVEAFSSETLDPRWKAALDAPVRGTPAVVATTVVVTTVTGRMVALDARDGAMQWDLDSPDPLHQWGFNDPTTDGSVVIAGDFEELRCVEVTSGAVRWRVRGMGARTNLVARASCVIADGLVVGGFWPGTPRFALDLTDGITVWADPPAGPSFADAFTGPSPQATPAVDAATGLVIVPCAGRVDALDPQTGETAWGARLPIFFNLASPVVTRAGIVLTLPGRGVTMIDRHSGERLWSVDISGPAPFPMIPYERVASSPVFAAPCVVDDTVVLPGLDGVLRVLDLDDGAPRRELPVGVPVAAPPLSVDGRVIVRGTDSSLRVVYLG
jgi:outer membrane protein assembly factor BamB